MLYFFDGVWIYICEIFYIVPSWIIYWHTNDFIIRLTAVDHFHHSYWPNVYDTAWKECIGCEYDNIQCIAIVPKRPRCKSVVCWVVLASLHCSIELDKTSIFINFVLVFCPTRALNNHSNFVWSIVPC